MLWSRHRFDVETIRVNIIDELVSTLTRVDVDTIMVTIRDALVSTSTRLNVEARRVTIRDHNGTMKHQAIEISSIMQIYCITIHSISGSSGSTYITKGSRFQQHCSIAHTKMIKVPATFHIVYTNNITTTFQEHA
jgi:hypothetical protein